VQLLLLLVTSALQDLIPRPLVQHPLPLASLVLLALLQPPLARQRASSVLPVRTRRVHLQQPAMLVPQEHLAASLVLHRQQHVLLVPLDRLRLPLHRHPAVSVPPARMRMWLVRLSARDVRKARLALLRVLLPLQLANNVLWVPTLTWMVRLLASSAPLAHTQTVLDQALAHCVLQVRSTLHLVAPQPQVASRAPLALRPQSQVPLLVRSVPKVRM
jgi:hypothetical protein